MKTLTLAYEPHPDARLAVAARDLTEDDLGVICSFGAGYSIGSLIVHKR